MLKPRERKYETFEDQLTAHVRHEGDHWLWIGCLDGHGYGKVEIGRAVYRAHRIAYELYRGPIPSKHILHHIETCPYKHCINPWHLEPMPQSVHVRQSGHMAYLKITQTHCIRGHPFTPENIIRNRKDGRKQCRVCVVEGKRRRYRLSVGKSV